MLEEEKYSKKKQVFIIIIYKMKVHIYHYPFEYLF